VRPQPVGDSRSGRHTI